MTAKENRLARETSPYLRQHAANPVDWYPWGEEALERARKEDKPIFLSIGYSACHWCHVMAHESFEDEGTAAFLNENFISIKVDREERPDIDSLYMRAVNLMTGGGGWPLTVFLTPDLKPFYGGTYFPKEPRYGMPSFMQLLDGISNAYRNKRSEIDATGSRALDAVSKSFSPFPPGEIPGAEAAKGAAEAVLKRYDAVEGGFGGGPKFPQPPLLDFLLVQSLTNPKQKGAEEVLFTLRKMESGGIRDQVAGGFHRYSVDGHWLVPHFEKMLYDNAQLASLYFRAYVLTGEERFREVGEEILEDLSESMNGAGGGFVAALDADSDGREGAFYVWTKGEWDRVLGKDAEWMAKLYGVTGDGNFEEKNVLHRVMAFDDAAALAGLTPIEFRKKLKVNRRKLAKSREARPHPGVDTKVLTDWNSLAAMAHADAYLATGKEEYLDRANKVLELIWTRCRRGKILRHVWDGKAAKVDGFLADYSFTAMAEWRAYEADGRREHLERLEWLIPGMLARFRDQESGLFYESPVGGTKDLVLRVRDTEDGVLPAAQSIAGRVLLLWERLSGSEAASGALDGMLKAEAGILKSHPGSQPLLAGIAAEKSRPPVEVVVSGASGDAEVRSLLKAARSEAAPTWVVLPLYTDLLPEPISEKYPLFKGRRGDKAAAYVCVGGACKLPITDPEKLKVELRRLKAKN